MSISNKLKWKRALSRMRFNYEELELVKETSRATSQEFQEYYEQFCRDRDINISQLNDQHRDRVNTLYDVKKTIPDSQSPGKPDIDPGNNTTIALHNDCSNNDSEMGKEFQMTADEIAIHEAFSKLFKRIALKIHPDKFGANTPVAEKESMVIMFQKANKSFEERKYYILLDIAEKLNISTPKNYAQQSRWMKKENKKIQQQIEQEKSTYNFLFSEAESAEEKENIIRCFILQVFQMHVE